MSANNLNTPTTASSRTRNTRSRFSSPQTAAGATTNGSHAAAATTGNNASFTRAAAAKANGNGNSNGHGSSGSGNSANGTRANSVSGEGQKTFMDRWLEPPVQVKASYQDAGLVRQGVFENMAPLGTLPKVGLFKKTAPAVAATPERTVRRIIVKQRSATATLPSTPAPILPPPPPPSKAATAATPGPATEADETEEEEDQEGEERKQDDEQITIGSTGTTGKSKSNGKGKSAGGRAGGVKLKLTSSATASTAASASQESQRPQRSQSQLSQASGDTENVDEAAAEWAPAAGAAATHQKSTRRRSRRSVSRASTSTSTVAANSTTGGSQQLEPAAQQQAQSLQQQTQQQTSHHGHQHSHSQSQQQQPAQNQSAQQQQQQQLSPQVVARVVQNAVVEALAHQQYPTAWALRTMFDENSASQAYVGMFQRVFNQTASVDELVHFGRMLQVRKREGKKNNRAYHYFMPDAPVGQAIPAPQPASYSDLVNFNMADLLRAAPAGSHATVNASAATVSAVTGDAAAPAAGATPAATTTAAKSTKPQKKKKRARSKAPSVAASSSEAAASDETTVAAAADEQQQQKQLEQSEEPEAEAEIPPRKKRKSTRQQQQQQKQPEASALTTPAAPTAPTPSAAASSSKMTTRKAKAKGKGKGKAAATPAETPSSRRRTRAGSVSSISSLSSARSLTPPDSIQGEQDQEHGDQGGPAQQEGEEGQGFDEARPSQPIRLAQRRRSNAPRKSRNVSPSQTAAASSSSSSSTAAAALAQGEQQSALHGMNAEAAENQGQEQTEAAYEMPAVVDSPLFPNLKKGWAKLMTDADVTAQLRVKRPYTEEEKAEFRSRARQMTSRPAIHSSIRPDAPIDDEADEQGLDDFQLQLPLQPEPATPTPAATGSGSRTTRNTAAAAAAAAAANTALSSARATPAPVGQTLPASTREGRSTRASLKRTHDDLNDDPSSPTTNGGFNLPFFPAGSEAPSTATGAVGGADSRAGTPALRAAKRPRTGLRVKNSPMKKKNGPSAGIPRPSGERSSPVGGAPREDDNDDYCSSCSGNGELVCCDGCTRSFHFGCVDPILRPETMPVEWFCNVCRTRREPSQLPVHGGAFALVMEKLDARNSSAFRLPALVRDRFEGVRTGADGEYEEISTAPKPNARKKKNDEEQAFDNYRVRDADGNAVICHKCQQATATDRPIIPCSACGIYWHTDCLDPPMPNPPFVLRTWKCPLHADTLLANFPNTLHPAHRHRKIKDAPVISPTYKRGFANNGHIEVDLDDSADESGWRDVETFGRTVRLSEKGIKLDFISRIQERSQARRRAALLPEPAARITPELSPDPVPVASDPLNQRSLNEQQAALNLARLNTTRNDGVSTLVEAMISEANPSVIDMMARVQPSHLESNSQLNQLDQQGLRAILAQAESMTQHIRQLLTSAQPAQTEPTPTSSNATNLPASQPLDHETDNVSGSTSASGNTDPNAMDVDENDDNMDDDDDDGTTNNGAASKTPASPAPTDDVPAMTQGEKTPIQGDQSPAVPTATAAAVPADGALVVEKGDGNGDGVLSTPTKTAAMIAGEEPVVLEGEGEDGQEEKNMEI